jgi:hypothetical protein
MKTKEIQATIGEYLKYDETSPTCLRWIKKPCKHIKIGDVAGSKNTEGGYYRTMFNGKLHMNHRIIFFLNYGYCSKMIDHIDCCRTNNKIDNLREATHSENCSNAKLRNNNKSGHKGVSKNTKGKYSYWIVKIRRNKKLYSKTFALSEFQEACEYADALRKKLHGDFANVGGVK